MTVRIACDLDGTVADMEGALQREAERLFGPDVDLRARGHSVLRRPAGAEGADAGPDTESGPLESVPPPLPDAPPAKRALTQRETRALWAHVRAIDNFWTTLGEIEPGSVTRLALLAEELRWEVLFITQRPPTAGDTAQRQSQRWLDARGFRYPSVYVMSGSRGRLADALKLDAVVDDRPENCIDIKSDSKAHTLLVWRDDPSQVPPSLTRLGIVTVPSFAAALGDLQALSARLTREPGLLGRMRASLGI